jgi:hypothetical protein
MTPKQVAILLREYRVKWLGAAKGRRTTVQIKCPHIIDFLPTNLTTEDEELGTDHSCGWTVTMARSGTIEHNAGPLSRYWSAKL